MATLSALYRSARTRLTEAGVDDAALDARLLVGHVTGSTQEDIVCRPMQAVAADVAERLTDAIDRRLAGEPVHRIIGSREFFGLKLAMSSETLEPRPDTEVLVDLVLPHARRISDETGRCRILDLGTGSGAIGLALASQLPVASVVLTDLSEEALDTARQNARALGLDSRVHTLVSDWFVDVDGNFDLVVSNPPYIPTADIAGLSPEVRLFDPLRALDGGADGLDAYRSIADGARAHLAPGGIVAVEFGKGQERDVAAIFEASNFVLAGSARDLSGIERSVLFSLR